MLNETGGGKSFLGKILLVGLLALLSISVERAKTQEIPNGAENFALRGGIRMEKQAGGADRRNICRALLKFALGTCGKFIYPRFLAIPPYTSLKKMAINVITPDSAGGASAETLMGPPSDYLRQIVLDSSRDLPLHAQLRTALERLILDHFENESRFYSESQLVGNLRVSQGTVRRALADLASRGLLEKRQARCTVVRKPLPGKSLRNLAIFLPDFSSPNLATYLNDLNAECQTQGIQMQPIYTHQGDRLIEAYESLKFGPHEGGVVLMENSPRATTELLAALRDKGYDCVVVGTIIKDAAHKFVGGSNRSMVTAGLRHLVELGHRRIALLVNEPEEKVSVQERIEAFESWTASSDIPLDARVVRVGMRLWQDAHQVAQRAMDAAMSANPPPTAIFAISDIGAFGAIKWLHQKKFRVPGDVSVIGIDGNEMGAFVHPALTTLASPREKITQGIFDLLARPKSEAVQSIFEPNLIVRESTAMPKVTTVFKSESSG